MFPGSQVRLFNFCVRPNLDPDSRVAARNREALRQFVLGTRVLLFDYGRAGNIYFSFPLRAVEEHDVELQFPRKMGHISRPIIWDINPGRRRKPTNAELSDRSP